MDTRPVHIFSGDSNTCKSHIAALTGKSIFETDSISNLSELPEVITQDIVVIGNMWVCPIDAITSRLFGSVNVIYVEFREGV